MIFDLEWCNMYLVYFRHKGQRELKHISVDKIPDTVYRFFEHEGIAMNEVLLSLRSDIRIDGSRGDCFVLVLKDRFAVAEGSLVFSSEGRNTDGRAIRNENFSVTRFETILLSDIGEPKAEQLISTGRITAESNGEERLIYNFSSTYKHSASVFCRAVSDLKKKGTLDEAIYAEEDYKKHSCPKCHRRYPDEELKICPHCMDKASLIKRLATLFFRYKRAIFLVLFSFAMIAALGVLTPYVSNELLYDNVLGNADSTSLDVLNIVLFIIGIRLCMLVVNLISYSISATVAADVTYDLKKMIFNTISNLSLGFFTNRQTGGLMTQVNRDSTTLYWFFCDGFPFLVLNIIQLTVIICVMFSQNFVLALYTFITIPIFFGTFKILNNVYDKFYAKAFSKGRSFNSLVSDVLNGMRVVKSFSREDEEVRRFGKINVGVAEARNDIQVFSSRVFPFLNYLLRIGSYVVWGVGGWQVMNATGDMSYGRLMAFIGYFSLIFGPIEQLADVSNWWSETLNALQRLFEIRDAQPEVRESANPIIPEKCEGLVEFKNVSFSYVENRKVIDDVSFTIPAHSTLGIVGQTGAGKSTLANLLTRLYDVKEGSICIDGVNIKDLPFEYLRENIAIVSQETYLFRGSILDNIRYARQDATKEEVIAAAKAASAHDFIVKYPDGYNTQIGFGQKELSGGEKQRISIARAILRNPKILILDEATAAMDTQTERSIQASLDKLTKNRTTVIIAHRLSTLRDADNLVAIENGRVAESGTAVELLKQKGVYYKLYKLQAEALKTAGIGE